MPRIECFRRLLQSVVMDSSGPMNFPVEIEREDDGRWIAEVPSLPGVLAYGKTRGDALAAAEALALRVLADRIEHGEISAEQVSLAFHSV